MFKITRQILSNSFRRKSINAFSDNVNTEDHPHLLKTLNLFDLLCVGIGGTVGSGVFLLSGFIAREYSGPEVIISWLIAGIACSFSAVSYAELSCRIPSSGSSYAYVYVTLGEWPAFIAAWCLSLECGLSSSAVARSWGVKLQTYLSSAPVDDSGINLFGGLLETFCVAVFYGGVSIGQLTVNVFTSAKVLLICFMVAVGLFLWSPEFIATSPPAGVTGILRGAAPCFFGYVGYDEVCCLSSEVADPKRTVPRAVFGTIFAVTVIYCLASVALVGMHDYRTLDLHSGFAGAFRDRGLAWAADITAIGELITLPVVVLVSFLAQPRIQFAMAVDGLIPQAFAALDRRGNLSQGILLSGVPCILLALFVPFTALEELISAGVLLCFSLTDAALILLRLQDTEAEAMLSDARVGPPMPDSYSGRSSTSSSQHGRCKLLLLAFNVLSVALTSLVTQFDWKTASSRMNSSSILILLCIALLAMALLAVGWWLHVLLHSAENERIRQQQYQRVNVSSEEIASYHTETSDPALSDHAYSGHNHLPAGARPTMAGAVDELYRAPLVPFLPLMGLFVNAGLLVQLSTTGILLLVLYLGIATICYFAYSFHTAPASDDDHPAVSESPITTIGLNRFHFYDNIGSNDTTVELVHSPIAAIKSGHLI